MSFPYDGSSLPYPKTDKTPLPGGEDPTKNLQASDWNAYGAALDGLRNAIEGIARPTGSTKGLLEASTGAIDLRDKGAALDGVTDDSAAWTAALAAVGGLFRKIYVGPGVSLAKNIAVNVPVEIYGPGTVKLKALSTHDASPVFRVTASGVVFRDVTIDGNKAAQPADGYSDAYENLSIFGYGRSYRAGIRADSVTGLDVIGVKFKNTFGACVATSDSSRVRIVGCNADSCYFELAYLSTSAGAFQSYHSIIGNRVTNIGTGDPTVNADACVLNHASEFAVIGNSFHTVERNAVKAEYCRRGVIVGNTIDTTTIDNFAGLQTQGDTTDILIAKNSIRNTGAGIALNNVSTTNVAVLGNTIETTTGSGQADGILLGAGTVDGLKIDGNVLRDIKRQIISIQPGGAVKNLSVNGNIGARQSSVVGGSFGLLVSLTGGNCVGLKVGNNVFDTGAVAVTGGIYLGRAAAETISMASITDNLLIVGAGQPGFVESAAMTLSGRVNGNFTDGNAPVYTSTTWEKNDTALSGLSTLAAAVAMTVTANVGAAVDYPFILNNLVAQDAGKRIFAVRSGGTERFAVGTTGQLDLSGAPNGGFILGVKFNDTTHATAGEVRVAGGSGELMLIGGVPGAILIGPTESEFSVGTATATLAAGIPLTVNGAGGPTLRAGAGSPEGAVTAVVGSLYLRSNGGAATSIYVKESGSGNTGWVAK